MTAGEPRKAAMIHAQKLADEKWAAESHEGESETDGLESNITSTAPFLATLDAASLSGTPSSVTTDAEIEEFGEDSPVFSLTSDPSKSTAGASGGSFLSSWYVSVENYLVVFITSNNINPLK